MADEKVGVKIVVDTGDANEQIKGVNDNLKDTDNAAKKAEKSAKDAGGAFSTIGNALKSLGVISLVMKGFELFQQILMKNQKVADALSTAMNVVTGVLSDLVGFIADNAGVVVDFFKDVFENPKVYIDKLAEAIKNNLIERVSSVIDAFGFLGTAIKSVFTGDFDAAKKAAADFGKEMVDVVTGVDDAVGKVTTAVSDLAKAGGEYFDKKLKQAKDLTKATNDAVIAEASMVNAIKQTQIAAEKLRQQRDDENRSLEDRIQANKDLADVLTKGQDQELKLIDIKAQKINAEIALNGKNKELQAQLIALDGERADIVEKYTGLRSEQLLNENTLLKEQAQIQRSVQESNNKIFLDTKKANAELIKDEVQKLEAKKAILEEESSLELNRLQQQINNTTAGTTARSEAEIAFAQKKAEIDNQIIAAEDELTVTRLNKELERIDKLRESNTIQFEEKLATLNEEQTILDEALASRLISEEDYTAKVKVLTDQRIAYQDAELQSKLQYASSIGTIFGQLNGLFEQGTAAAKASALAEIAINTGIGFVQGLDIAQKSAKATGPGAAFAFPIFYATQIAAVLAAANKAKGILSSVKGGGASAPGISLPSIPSASAPIAPTQPPTQTSTQLNQSGINAAGSAVMRAYVVESDITESQERITRITRAARLG